MPRSNFSVKGHARLILELCAVIYYRVEYRILTTVSTPYPCS